MATNSQNISLVGPDGKVRCFLHALEATLRTSHGITNSNRQFYTCSLSGGEQCDFFVWRDELPNSETSHHLAQTRAQGQPTSTPTESSTASTRFPPLVTPTSQHIERKPWPTSPQRKPWPVSPSKRSSPYNTDAARQKRLKAIQDALSSSTSSHPKPDAVNAEAGKGQQNSSATTTRSSTAQPPPATPPSARANRLAQTIREALKIPESSAHTSTSGSSTVTEVPTGHGPGQVPKSTPPGPLRYNLAELGYEFGGRRRPFVNQDNVPPQAQPQQPLLQPPEMENMSMFSNEDSDAKSEEEELWDAVSGQSPTPSTDEVAKSLLQQQPDEKGKGKQKAVEENPASQESGVNWFMDVPPTKHLPSTLFSPVSAMSQTLLPPPSSSSAEEPGLSGDKIQNIIDWLADVPDYVRKLERKLMAMEKSNAVKAERIRELEEEVQELKSPKRGASSLRR